MTHEIATEWIETTNVKQDGTPVTRAIRVPEMETIIFFTTNAYAEVGTDVADLLVNNIDSIQRTSEPSEPGTYYGKAGDQQSIKLNVSDDAVGDLSVSGDLTVHQSANIGDIGFTGGMDLQGESIDNVQYLIGDTTDTQRIAFTNGVTRIQAEQADGAIEDIVRIKNGGNVQLTGEDLTDANGNVIYDQGGAFIPWDRIEGSQSIEVSGVITEQVTFDTSSGELFTGNYEDASLDIQDNFNNASFLEFHNYGPSANATISQLHSDLIDAAGNKIYDQATNLIPSERVEGGGGGGGGGVTGSSSFTGDGTTTSFTFSHGLSEAPAAVDIMPQTEPASADHWVSSVTSTDVTVTYSRAPADTVAIDFYWIAKGSVTTGGTLSATGDGTTTQFSTSHGLVDTPSYATVTPTSEPATTDHWVSVDSSNLYVDFSAAPADGATIEFFWEVAG